MEAILRAMVAFVARSRDSDDLTAFLLREAGENGPVLDAVYGTMIEPMHRRLCALRAAATGQEAESEATRLKSLAERGAVTTTQAEAEANIAIARLPARKQEIAAAEAAVEGATAAKARTAWNLSACRAPANERRPGHPFHGLVKRYGGRAVVDNVSLGVDRGEIAGFLGPNGSGKTTTIRLMCGLLTPDAGEDTVLGRDIRTEGRAIKREVGYMTQRLSFYEDLTIEENLNFVADTLPDLGLTARRDFRDENHRLAADGLTVPVSTHYMDEAERCHRINYISYGRLVARGFSASSCR